MHAESVEYQHAGRRYVGHLALPEGDDVRAAVLVCHEGPGLDEHAKQRAERLADLGYVAFALDYHGDGQPLDMPEVRLRLTPMMESPELTRALGRAGLDVLLAHRRTDPTRVAAIGFCFGGTMALELARAGTDLRAVVGFHSGLSTTRPQDAEHIRCVVLVCVGSEDPLIPADQRVEFETEMRAGNVDWRMNVYGGAAHSFTNERADELGFPGIAYDGPTDARAWRAMLDVFDEVLS
jgi:dienelactone hydrolase